MLRRQPARDDLPRSYQDETRYKVWDVIKHEDPIERMMKTIAAALGRAFPSSEQPPTREELLDAARVCSGAAEMARELAKQARAAES